MLLCQVTTLPSNLAPVGHSAKADWAEEALLSPAIVNNHQQRILPIHSVTTRRRCNTSLHAPVIRLNPVASD